MIVTHDCKLLFIGWLAGGVNLLRLRTFYVRKTAFHTRYRVWLQLTFFGGSTVIRLEFKLSNPVIGQVSETLTTRVTL